MLFAARITCVVMILSAVVFNAPWVDSMHDHQIRLASEFFPSRKLSREEITGLARLASLEHGVPLALVLAIIRVESNFNQRARSHRGAMGLMQITGRTARFLQVEDPYNPYHNVSAGTKYLRQLLDRFKGNRKLAIAAFNAGPTVVQKYRGIPPYRETREYVKRVLEAVEEQQADTSVIKL